MSVQEGQGYRGQKARSLIQMHCSLRYGFYIVWPIVLHCGQMSEKNIKEHLAIRRTFSPAENENQHTGRHREHDEKSLKRDLVLTLHNIY